MCSYTNDELRKKEVCEQYLSPLIKEIVKDVDRVTYEVTQAGMEIVCVLYNNDHCDPVLVTGDSLTALCCDVLAAIRWR